MNAFPMIARDPFSTPCITTAEVKRIVAAYYQVRPIEMESARRAREIVPASQIAMYLARRFTKQSFPVIGRCFGGRDHTTVMHAVRNVEMLRRSDPMTAHDVKRLEEFFAL